MVRTVLLTLACVACCFIMLIGAFCCLMGLEALTTGINPVPWLLTFALMIVLPCVGVIFSIRALVRGRRQ